MFQISFHVNVNLLPWIMRRLRLLLLLLLRLLRMTLSEARRRSSCHHESLRPIKQF
jgi:hypothetical protein